MLSPDDGTLPFSAPENTYDLLRTALRTFQHARFVKADGIWMWWDEATEYLSAFSCE